MDESDLMGLSGGEAETPVPEVDPADVKAVWQLINYQRIDYPKGGVAIGMASYRHACKPGANVKAVWYRAMEIEMLRCSAPDVMESLIHDKLDAVCIAAAQIPMIWVGKVVHRGWTFDPDDFIRRVGEAA